MALVFDIVITFFTYIVIGSAIVTVYAADKGIRNVWMRRIIFIGWPLFLLILLIGSVIESVT